MGFMKIVLTIISVSYVSYNLNLALKNKRKHAENLEEK